MVGLPPGAAVVVVVVVVSQLLCVVLVLPLPLSGYTKIFLDGDGQVLTVLKPCGADVPHETYTVLGLGTTLPPGPAVVPEDGEPPGAPVVVVVSAGAPP